MESLIRNNLDLLKDHGNVLTIHQGCQVDVDNSKETIENLRQDLLSKGSTPLIIHRKTTGEFTTAS
jgi:hypothetical protein